MTGQAARSKSRTGAGAAAILLAVTAGLLAGPGPAAAQGIETFTLSFDNDGLNFWIPPSRRTDRYYTHGGRMDFVVAGALPGAGALLGELEPCSDAGLPPGTVATPEGVADGRAAPATAGAIPPPACGRTRVRITQRIYTPQNVFFYTPGDGDHPYGGWLSATVGSERVSRTRTRSVALEVGVTGGPSLARKAHEAFHRWLDKFPPQGWQHEIPFEVGVQAHYREARRWPAEDVAAGEGPFFGTSHVGGTVGTVRAAGSAGLGMGLALGAPVDGFGSGPSPRKGWLVATLGVEAEVVAWDTFIDGSLWNDSHGTDRNPLLARWRLGLTTGWNGLALRLGVTRTSKEFRDQTTPHTFTTVGLVLGG